MMIWTKALVKQLVLESENAFLFNLNSFTLPGEGQLLGVKGQTLFPPQKVSRIRLIKKQLMLNTVPNKALSNK